MKKQLKEAMGFTGLVIEFSIVDLIVLKSKLNRLNNVLEDTALFTKLRKDPSEVVDRLSDYQDFLTNLVSSIKEISLTEAEDSMFGRQDKKQPKTLGKIPLNHE